MKVKFSILLTILLHCHCLISQDFEYKMISGIVKMKNQNNGKLVPVAQVTITDNKKRKVAITDANGKFKFNYRIPMQNKGLVFKFNKFNFLETVHTYDGSTNFSVRLFSKYERLQLDVTGEVLDESGNKLDFVNIRDEFGLNRAITNYGGQFSFQASCQIRSDKILETYIFELMGYEVVTFNSSNPKDYDNMKVVLKKSNGKKPKTNKQKSDFMEDDFKEGAIAPTKKTPTSKVNTITNKNESVDELHSEIDIKNEEIDSSSTVLSTDKLEEFKEYIAYLETILEQNELEFDKQALGQDNTIHQELKSKLIELKEKVAEKEKEVEKEQKKNWYLWLFILLIILVLIPSILAVIFYINNKKTKKLNVVLDGQNTELKKAYYHIHSSVVYAQRIQQSILVKPEGIKKHFQDAFVFFRPKDIVSGDFYWFAQVESKFIIAAVDCTGHGVPGAFMTMMGNSILNEIVNERKITDPGKILLELHKKIQQALKTGGETTSNDGMDIALTTVDVSAKKNSVCGC